MPTTFDEARGEQAEHGDNKRDRHEREHRVEHVSHDQDGGAYRERI
jgi:hypothetical protein